MASIAEPWIQALEILSEDITNEYDALSIDTLLKKNSEKDWSIAQIFSHIITVNESYYPLFDQIQKGKYVYSMLGNFGFIRKYFGRIILKSVQPSNPKKQKTLPLWQPKENVDATSIIPDIKNHLNSLASKIEDLQPLIKRNVTVASPANERIVYDLQTALDIIVAHAWRHFEQAKKLK